MKKVLLVISSLFALSLSAQEVKSKSYQAMLKTLLSHSVPEKSVSEVSTEEGATLLDAREQSEFLVSKIEYAEWVGYNDFSLERVKHLDKDEEIIVYCSVGYRSEKVAEQLIDAGYTNVSNLYGGIFEWKNQGHKVVDSGDIGTVYNLMALIFPFKNQGHKVVDSADIATDQVHAYDKMWGVWLKKGKKVYK